MGIAMNELPLVRDLNRADTIPVSTREGTKNITIADLEKNLMVVQENLLYNPALTVNQRGKASYENEAGYMFDGWYRGNPGAAKIINGAWKLTQGTNRGFICCQRLERLVDGVYTLSIRVASVTGTWSLLFLPAQKTVKITSPGLYFVTGNISGYNSQNYAVVLYSDNAGDTITFPGDGGSIFKLEHGDHQTLAMYQDGILIPLEYPCYQIELLKCQRLFNRIVPNAYLNTSSNPGLYELLIQYPEMRKVPNVVLTGSKSEGELNIRAELTNKSTCLIRSNAPSSYLSAIELTAEL